MNRRILFSVIGGLVALLFLIGLISTCSRPSSQTTYTTPGSTTVIEHDRSSNDGFWQGYWMSRAFHRDQPTIVEKHYHNYDNTTSAAPPVSAPLSKPAPTSSSGSWWNSSKSDTSTSTSASVPDNKGSPSTVQRNGFGGSDTTNKATTTKAFGDSGSKSFTAAPATAPAPASKARSFEATKPSAPAPALTSKSFLGGASSSSRSFGGSSSTRSTSSSRR